MGCNSSRSAGADAVVSNSNNNSDTDQPPRRISNDVDPLYFSPNQARLRFELDDDFPSNFLVPVPQSSGSTDDHRRNARLTILNVPSRSRLSRNGNQDSTDSAVLEQLQLDLITIERIFQNLLGQPYQSGASTTEPLRLGDSCPPASIDAIKAIPSINITQEDLEDENNRSCCICFGDHKLGEKVARLPCGHIFHRKCVSEWLEKHCTCPFCRWELKTSDVGFNRGRLERMRSRRVRIKTHELERMSLSELKDLAETTLDSAEFIEENRSELIKKIKSSNMVDIVSPSNELCCQKEQCNKVEEEKEEIAVVSTQNNSDSLAS